MLVFPGPYYRHMPLSSAVDEASAFAKFGIRHHKFMFRVQVSEAPLTETPERTPRIIEQRP